MIVLGINIAHDSSAALLKDGEILASVSEERFTRIKNDASFPVRAIEYCLDHAGIQSEAIDVLAVGSEVAPPELSVFFKNIPEPQSSSAWSYLRKFKPAKPKNPFGLPRYQKPWTLSPKVRVHYCHHHRAHAASAYYTSGLQAKAIVVTLDGLGDGLSGTLWRAQDNKMERIEAWGPEASLAWFYGNATEALGWRQASDEWKVMGLAPYGEPGKVSLKGFYPEFKDGALHRSHDYGVYEMWHDHGAVHWHNDDSIALAKIAEQTTPEHFAAEVQRIAEEQAMNLILPWIEKEACRHFCFAGGFFLNVKFNQRLWALGQLETQWIYPNAGDAGLALGAALDAYYAERPDAPQHKLEHLYYGSSFDNEVIGEILEERGIAYEYAEDVEAKTAEYLAQNKVIGWFQGRMEDGPRALGNRSILMSPLNPANKDIINAKVKYREAFRPFCPAMLHEKRDLYLKGAREELFMVTSFDVCEDKHAKIPAVVHADGTGRPQMVQKHTNERFWNLIHHFGALTGEYVLLNTSFNVKGEPIVHTPREAIKCFYDTGLDVLVLGNYIIKKTVPCKY